MVDVLQYENKKTQICAVGMYPRQAPVLLINWRVNRMACHLFGHIVVGKKGMAQ